MNEKTLEPESRYSKYDLDGDGVVTDEELEMDAKMMRLDNEDKKEDAQRYMAWFALFGMLLYPALVVFSTFVSPIKDDKPRPNPFFIFEFIMLRSLPILLDS